MKTLLVSESNGILQITLNRPDVRNAFSAEMIHELTEVFRSVDKKPGLRAVHLKGEGKVFCAGADLSYMQSMVKFSIEKNQEEALALHDMFESIRSCAVPVVAEVHGAAFGGGLGLIAASDFVIAEEKTQYCFSEVKLGLAPAVISDFVLRKATIGMATPWMLSGMVFSSEEAQRIGLVHLYAYENDAKALVEKVLQTFREAGPEALRETKSLLQEVPRLSMDQARSETARVIAERRVSEEGQEGIKAFLEKRTPKWRLS